MLLTKEMAVELAFDVIEIRQADCLMRMYCTLCDKTLLYNCKSTMTGTKGKCDCSWFCCEQTAMNVHPAHIAYAPQESAYIGVIPKNYAFCMDVNGTPDEGIRR